ncbi:MAG: AbrB/MazE/SpoVT family DNA-binding domain-containing protein [Oscillospiraceae bacterium]|nr:AbrB/MazE/SpoVT family DNA-binding domain-containing protein [Oscillospiraceae bacterium]
MQITETTFTVSRSGNLKIPASVLREMGLFPGDHIRIAYLTHDGQANSFQEFLLSADPLEDLTDAYQLHVPNHLLNRANIPVAADLQIICLNGLIVICPDTVLSPDELSAILKNLQTAEDLIRGLPIGTAQAQAQLEKVINELQKGEVSNDV